MSIIKTGRFSVVPATIYLDEEDVMCAILEMLERHGWRRPPTDLPMREHVAICQDEEGHIRATVIAVAKET